jgi:predicted secreted protein
MRHGAGFALAKNDERYKRIAVGDTFSVELPGKETSGYGWSLTPGDPTVVATDNGKTFVATGPGETRLVFTYRHPYENRGPIEIVTIDVQVDRWGWKTLLGVGAAVVATAGGITYAVKRKKAKK